MPREGQTETAAPEHASRRALHRLAEGLGRLTMALEVPEHQGQAAVEARALWVPPDCVTIARRRLAPAPGAAEGIGQVYERLIGHRLDAEGFGKRLGRLAMTALPGQGESAADLRHGVARGQACRLAEG